MKGRSLLPAVPDDDVRLVFGLCENFGVDDAGVDHRALGDVSLVLLSLFDGAVVAVQVLVPAKRCTRCSARSP